MERGTVQLNALQSFITTLRTVICCNPSTRRATGESSLSPSTGFKSFCFPPRVEKWHGVPRRAKQAKLPTHHCIRCLPPASTSSTGTAGPICSWPLVATGIGFRDIHNKQ
ncbi:hypothetical protein BDW66DRAFT_118230 [Aspergillus desertorum]